MMKRILAALAVSAALICSAIAQTVEAPIHPIETVSTGTLAGEVLTWLVAAFGVPIGGLLVLLAKRAAALVGVKLTQQMSDRLDDIIVRGLNAGAVMAKERLEGHGDVEVKNAVVASAVEYAQDHGADTIKALGLDPQSGKAVEALKARIATLITDPTQPTPDVLDSAAPKAPPLSVAATVKAV